MTKGQPKLDKKDLRILLELENNCRKTNKHIARAARLSKEAVSYRINKLLNAKIIRGFSTIIDYQKLGLNVGTFLIKTRGLSNDNEMKFIEHLKEINYTSWIGKTMGRWDFLIAFMYKDTYDLNAALTKMMNAFSEKISEYKLLFDLDNYYFSGKVLFESLNSEVTPCTFSLGENKIGENKNPKIDSLDLKLLKTYSSDARLSFLKASKKLNCSLNTVKYRLKTLEEKGIIKSYSARINYNNLNFIWAICFFKLKNFSEDNKKPIISYLKQRKNVTFVVNTVGEYVDCDVQIKSSKDLEIFLKDVRNLFEDNLVSIDTLNVTKVFKQNFLPIDIMLPKTNNCFLSGKNTNCSTERTGRDSNPRPTA